MSQFWNPDWHQPSARMTFIEPTTDLLEKLAGDPPEWFHDEYREHINLDDCSYRGQSKTATFGPDYTVLVNAVRRAHAAEVQRNIGRLTFYFICTRPRVIPQEALLSSTGSIQLRWKVEGDDGIGENGEIEAPADGSISDLSVSDDGMFFRYRRNDGEEGTLDPALVAQSPKVGRRYEPSLLDLEVRYIGRARGELAEKCALDRLQSHEKYQQVLEEVSTGRHRNRDVWLVLGAGTNVNLSETRWKYDEPVDRDYVLKDTARVRSLLSTSKRIDITEALLINYFKPSLNKTHTGSLDLSAALFKPCYLGGLTGLRLWFDSGDFGIAMYTDAVARKLVHAASFPLHASDSTAEDAGQN